MILKKRKKDEIVFPEYDDKEIVQVRDFVLQSWELGDTHGLSHWQRVERNGLLLSTQDGEYRSDVCIKVVRYFAYLHELRLKFRNYNIEVDVACNHIKMQNLPLTALACDFDNLLFKPLNLTTDTFKYGESLGAAEQEYKAMIAIIKCHFENMIKAENLSKLIKQIPAASKLLKNECEYIKKNIEKEEDGGIKRSLKNLCKKNSSNNEECSLNKNSVLEQLYPKTNKNNSKQDADNEKIIRQLVNLEKVDKEYFNKWITSVFNGHQDAIQSASDIYDALKPYLDYINMEKWDFRTLFYYMLAVDTVIESRKIGMINY